MASKSAPAPKRVQPRVEKWTLTLSANDQLLTGTGETCLEALQALPAPTKMMGKAILTIEHGTERKERLYMPTELKRLFYNKHFLVIQAKNLQIGMK